MPNNDSLPPPRAFGPSSGRSTYVSPGARKEKLRQRDFSPPRRTAPVRPWAELHAASAFSFLEGATLPEDLVDRAAQRGLGTLALTDRAGLSGIPRFHKAALAAGLRPLVGAEVILDEAVPSRPPAAQQVGAGPLGLVPEPGSLPPGAPPPRLLLLAASREGYRNLCRLLTAAALGRPKGEARASWGQVEAHGTGLFALTGGDEGVLARALADGGLPRARRLLDRLAAAFPGRVAVELQRHRRREEELRNRVAIDLARARKLPLVATNGVRYGRPEDKELFDVLTATRIHRPLDRAGRELARNRERHVKGPAEMAALFADLPEAIDGAWAVAQQLDFTLADLGYRFPEIPLPPGETPDSALARAAWEGARSRFRPLSARAQAQVSKELAVIAKLGLAGYFLIVHEIVLFCRREGILVQGRGSAANSAVCYALGITAVDPVRMELLFERFLSEERGEWPDIDLDLPSGPQREKVIQHVYALYGPHGAAMTANVITYRERSAAREVGKAMGWSEEQLSRLSARMRARPVAPPRPGDDRPRGDLHAISPDEADGPPDETERPGDVELSRDDFAAAGLDPEDPRSGHFLRMFRRVLNLPRHLGQHSGGMVVAAGRLDDVVPLEPASMPGRVIVQWDKDDCADLGIVKIDLLGLGILAALEEAIPVIRAADGVSIDLAHLPADDPKTWSMIRAADTVATFQIESRAQMASLPRHAPERFYDLVIQVAIIRPGPIGGGLMQKFFDRRQGKEEARALHPSLEPVLARTLGVPIFQEQILRMAMVAAGFTGGEAEELRRAMGFKRSVERMEAIEARLRSGMTARGIVGADQDEIVRWITAFAMYGFPESHAASFALLAWASAYLRAHYPASWLACWLNAWPMGFYHPSTILKDAQRHGVEVRPMDVDRSGWRCRREGPAVRLGLRFADGLRAEAGERIERERRIAPFRDVDDLVRRCALRRPEVDRLAELGALASFGLTRRAALWQAARAVRPAGPLFEGLPDDGPPSPLPEMSKVAETLADYAGSGLTAGPHLLEHFRAELRRRGIASAAEVLAAKDGERLVAGGIVVVRQHPPAAKGFVFLALEDETGMFQAIVRPALYEERRSEIVGSAALLVEGRVQNERGAVSIRADAIRPLPLEMPAAVSHDFR